MSFAEQERALFDLVFDQTLRDQFCADATASLTDYQLTDAELSDFGEIMPTGLQLDAALRVEQILGQFCHQLPVSFALVSALNGGIELLKKLVNTTTMLTPPVERATRYGQQLQQRLHEPDDGIYFGSPHQQAIICAIVDAEVALVWTAVSLKHQHFDEENHQTNSVITETLTDRETLAELPENWQKLPIEIGSNIVATLLPLSYATLKSALASREATLHWRHLARQPLTDTQLDEILSIEAPTLFIARAYVSSLSRCEVRVDHLTVELNDGFAPLLQQVNGKNSVDQISKKLIDVGASDSIVAGVNSGFKQLLESAIIKLV